MTTRRGCPPDASADCATDVSASALSTDSSYQSPGRYASGKRCAIVSRDVEGGWLVRWTHDAWVTFDVWHAPTEERADEMARRVVRVPSSLHNAFATSDVVACARAARAVLGPLASASEVFVRAAVANPYCPVNEHFRHVVWLDCLDYVIRKETT